MLYRWHNSCQYFDCSVRIVLSLSEIPGPISFATEHSLALNLIDDADCMIQEILRIPGRFFLNHIYWTCPYCSGWGPFPHTYSVSKSSIRGTSSKNTFSRHFKQQCRSLLSYERLHSISIYTHDARASHHSVVPLGSARESGLWRPSRSRHYGAWKFVAEINPW